MIEWFFSRLASSRTLATISQMSDVILAGTIVVILGLMIIPIPSALLDALIALNMMAAISLLMVSIYISSATHLTVFPSLLLFTTLFRLGLNISSTRSILLHADAGAIIHTFGHFVAGSNYVVGFILFLIITLIQFIVITKGAERVAEVAARFTLDAMPGKQMSIDADMRAGILDAQQARQRRLDLQKESQLYGAMDGAMKFVKGDAIAGLVITLINIIGGIAIGMIYRNMEVGQAMTTYSLLSIGDGLVSQIPALMISITAGVITTRVTNDTGETNLGSDISAQVFKQPKALIVAAAASAGIGLIPGFPSWVFLPAALLLGGFGYMLWTAQRKKATGLQQAGEEVSMAQDTGVEGHSSVTGGGVDSYALTVPVILETGATMSQLIKQSARGMGFIETMIPKMRQALFHELGVRFPGVHVRVDSPTLDKEAYMIHLNEVPMIKGMIIPNYLLTNETEQNLKRYNLPFKSYKNSLNLPSCWVPESKEEILKNAGIRYWHPLEVVILHVSSFFRFYATEFIGVQEVRTMIEFVEKSFPDLVKEVTRLLPLQKMTDIFKRLIQEQISVKDLRTVMESLSEWAQTEKDTVLLTEYVRSSLKRYISYKYSGGQTVISVYILDPEIEDMVRGAIKQTSSGAYLSLDPDSVQLIMQAVRTTVDITPEGGQTPVILTAIDVRRFVKKLVETELQEVAVLSYQEIIPEIKIQPLGRIQLG